MALFNTVNPEATTNITNGGFRGYGVSPICLARASNGMGYFGPYSPKHYGQS
jgi:hypothetical protein